MKQSRTMNYLKRFDSFSYNESVDTKPGEILDLPDIGIKGEVFLTEEIEPAYHGGIIDNIDTYLDKYALYLTHKKQSAVTWNLGANRRGWSFTRTYEVKIKRRIKFIECSPAGKDNGIGLNRIENVLVPLGVVGMVDRNFRNNIPTRPYSDHLGDMAPMNECVIFDKSSIESFRVIPFREIFNDKNLMEKESIREMEKRYIDVSVKIFKENQELYNDLKNKLESGEFISSPFRLKYKKGDEDSPSTISEYLRKNKNIQSKIDNIIESMSNADLDKYFSSPSAISEYSRRIS